MKGLICSLFLVLIILLGSCSMGNAGITNAEDDIRGKLLEMRQSSEDAINMCLEFLDIELVLYSIIGDNKEIQQTNDYIILMNRNIISLVSYKKVQEAFAKKFEYDNSKNYDYLIVDANNVIDDNQRFCWSVRKCIIIAREQLLKIK